MSVEPYLRSSTEHETPIGTLRLKMGLTLDQMQEQMGLSRNYICALSTGAKSPLYESNSQTISSKRLRTGHWKKRLKFIALGMGVPETDLLSDGITRKKGAIHWQAFALAGFFQCPVEELFPLYFCLLTKRSEQKKELLPSQVASLSLGEGSPSLEDILIWRERFARVMAILGNMEKRRAEIFIKHYFLGETFQEIATGLDKTISRALASFLAQEAFSEFIVRWNAIEREKAILRKGYKPDFFREVFGQSPHVAR